MAILPRYKRLKRRDWKDPFSWFNWFHTRNNPDPVFLYRPESGRVGMAGFTATRADATTCARYRDSSGIWQTAAANVLRDGHYHYDGTSNVVTILREGASTNSALGSCSFADGTYWAGNTGYTITTATSCISGQAAYKHVNAGGGVPRYQALGTFVNGQTDCFSVIVENVDCTTLRIGINDLTTVGWLCYVDFTWATKTVGAVSGTGTAGVIDLGGGRYRVWIAGTGTAAGNGAAGNLRYAYCYPCGVSATTTISAYWHHAQFEANASYPSSPIVTVAGAVTRAADSISVSWPYAPQAMTAYLDCYDLGASKTTLACMWTIGNTTGSIVAPILYLRTNGGKQTVTHNPDGTSVSSEAAAIANFGDRVEVRSVLASTGAVTLGQSLNSAAEAVGAASAARALVSPWAGSPPTLRIGSAAAFNPANIAIRSIAIVLGPEQSMAKLRQIARG